MKSPGAAKTGTLPFSTKPGQEQPVDFEVRITLTRDEDRGFSVQMTAYDIGKLPPSKKPSIPACTLEVSLLRALLIEWGKRYQRLDDHEG